MADFDIKEIASLKRQLRIIEKLTLAGWILIIAGFYYGWDTVPGIMLVVQIVLYILKEWKNVPSNSVSSGIRY